jgi:hypothetical protein
MTGYQYWSIHPASNQNLCVEVKDNYQRNGGVIQLAPYTGSQQQQWIIDPNTCGYICAGSNRGMDIGSDPRRGPNMIQWEFHRSPNQTFDYDPNTLKIRSRDGRFLDVNGSISPASTLCCIDDRPTVSQQWIILNVQNRSVKYTPPAPTSYGGMPAYGAPPAYGALPSHGGAPVYGGPQSQTGAPVYGGPPGYGAPPSYGRAPSYASPQSYGAPPSHPGPAPGSFY